MQKTFPKRIASGRYGLCAWFPASGFGQRSFTAKAAGDGVEMQWRGLHSGFSTTRRVTAKRRTPFCPRSTRRGAENCFFPRRNTENCFFVREVARRGAENGKGGLDFLCAAVRGAAALCSRQPLFGQATSRSPGVKALRAALSAYFGRLGFRDVQSPERPVYPPPRCAGGVLSMLGQTVNRAIVFQSLRRVPAAAVMVISGSMILCAYITMLIDAAPV